MAIAVNLLKSRLRPICVIVPAELRGAVTRASPTDVSAANPGITKLTFNVPVVIERNDVLLTLRSDTLPHLYDVLGWLRGNGQLNGRAHPSPGLGVLLEVTSVRLMFQQMGLPRRVADAQGLPYAGRINPRSPMWMGFADQQVAGSGPATITSFQGNRSARLTDARRGDYFDNGAVQHLSHVLLDLEPFHSDDEPYSERVQYMFRSNPIPSAGDADQYTDGGGPSFIGNVFQGTGDAEKNAGAQQTFGGAKENDSGEIGAVHGFLHYLRDTFCLAILLVHHLGKQDALELVEVLIEDVDPREASTLAHVATDLERLLALRRSLPRTRAHLVAA